MTKAFYNEIEPYAAQWLRNLIEAGLIATSRAIVAPEFIKAYIEVRNGE